MYSIFGFTIVTLCDVFLIRNKVFVSCIYLVFCTLSPIFRVKLSMTQNKKETLRKKATLRKTDKTHIYIRRFL